MSSDLVGFLRERLAEQRAALARTIASGTGEWQARSRLISISNPPEPEYTEIAEIGPDDLPHMGGRVLAHLTLDARDVVHRPDGTLHSVGMENFERLANHASYFDPRHTLAAVRAKQAVVDFAAELIVAGGPEASAAETILKLMANEWYRYTASGFDPAWRISGD